MKPKKMWLLLTLSILYLESSGQETYCAACSREAWEGDSVALNKFISGCGTIDTLSFDSLNRPETVHPVYKKITMKLNSGKVMFTDEIFMVPEVMPEFAGGEKALLKYLHDQMKISSAKYPIQGTVYITFIVERNGKIKHTSVKRSLQTELDLEAMRVVQQSPTWKPGMHEGKPVRVQMTIPVFIN